MRKASSGKNVHEFREVTPFYMQHSYSHFRYDPTYDIKKSESSNKTEQNQNQHGRKYSNQERKVSFLHQKLFNRNRTLSDVAGKVSNQGRRLSDEIVNQTKESNLSFNGGRRKSWTNEPNTFKKFSSNLSLEKRCSSLDENIQKWHLRSATLSDISSLTRNNDKDIERVADENKLPPIKQSNKIFTIGNDEEEIDGPNEMRTLKTHSYQDPVKAKRLKEMIQDRLGKGFTIADLVDDPSFDDVLEVCDNDVCFPAYEVGEEITFENYQKLRKCKYLRVSERNIASLKEAALAFLDENEI